MCLSSLETMGLPKAISLCTLCDGKLSDINSCDTPLNTTCTIPFPLRPPSDVVNYHFVSGISAANIDRVAGRQQVAKQISIFV